MTKKKKYSNGKIDNIIRICGEIERNIVVRSVRNGMVKMIPVLTIGAFALILMTFPAKWYIDFIKEFCGGFIYSFFNFVYSATFKVLSVYMVYTVSMSYLRLNEKMYSSDKGGILSSYICFFILSGVFSEKFNIDMLGAKSIFLALISALMSCPLYLLLRKKLNFHKTVYTAGADFEFQDALKMIFPIAAVTAIFAIVNYIVITLSGEPTFNDFLHSIVNGVFSKMNMNFGKGIMFVIISGVLWFFGLHGGDFLQGVSDKYFVPMLTENLISVASGKLPVNILTKEFFDCFVLIGGCGSTLCLLIAILVFSKERSRKRLAKTAAFPMLFNVNELMVFGLPLIFNPVMMIPFMLTPIVCYAISYFAIYCGFVPMITSSVQWTTPAFLGGYYATGSYAGAILQLMNILIGVLIYTPFVKLYDKVSKVKNIKDYESFIEYYKENESELQSKILSNKDNFYGNISRGLISDFEHEFENDGLSLYYQPQYSYDGDCVGVEALLRWNHSEYGMIYPPLIIKIASECGLLEALEEKILGLALSDRDRIYEKYKKGIKLSVNVTGNTIFNPSYIEYLHKINNITPFSDNNICLEITEQAAFAFSNSTKQILHEIKSMGIHLAIDDFSMGHTSIEYLKDGFFDIIKLDGTLVKGLKNNTRCREIILSITHLSSNLSLSVIAEFVETDFERQILHEIGCDLYQGYLFSKAAPI